MTSKADASSVFLLKTSTASSTGNLKGLASVFFKQYLSIFNEFKTQLLDRPLKQNLNLNPHRKMSFILSLT